MVEQSLITGTSGRVGHAVAEVLHAGGVGVVGVDRTPGRFTTVVADLATDDLSAAMAGCDSVVHCAALHAPHLTEHGRAQFVSANVTATDRVLDAAAVSGVKRFVFLSTTSVYGKALDDPERAVWVDERLSPEPRDVYDETKLVAEQLVSQAHDPTFATITLRLARCFPESPRRNVVNRLYRGLDLADAVGGISAALSADLTRHHVLNLGGPRVFEKVDTVELRRDAAAVIRHRVPWLIDEFAARRWELPSAIDRVYVSDAAQSAIGYRPTHGLRSALAVTRKAPRPRACPH